MKTKIMLAFVIFTIKGWKILSELTSHRHFQFSDLLLLGQTLHIQITAAAPLCPRYVPQPGCCQHQCRVPIRKTSNYPRTPAHLPHYTLKHVVRSGAIGDIT